MRPAAPSYFTGGPNSRGVESARRTTVTSISMRPKFLACVALVILASQCAHASDPIHLPDGFAITPDAAPHSIMMPLNPGISSRRNFTLGQAVTTALSPDGRQLLVLTSGYNRD